MGGKSKESQKTKGTEEENGMLLGKDVLMLDESPHCKVCASFSQD